MKFPLQGRSPRLPMELSLLLLPRLSRLLLTCQSHACPSIGAGTSESHITTPMLTPMLTPILTPTLTLTPMPMPTRTSRLTPTHAKTCAFCRTATAVPDSNCPTSVLLHAPNPRHASSWPLHIHTPAVPQIASNATPLLHFFNRASSHGPGPLLVTTVAPVGRSDRLNLKSSLACFHSLFVFASTLVVVLIAVAASQHRNRNQDPAVVAAPSYPTSQQQVEREQVDNPQGHPSQIAMTLKTVPPGHVGNLTSEQQDKLRRLWTSIFKVCGVADPAPNGSATSNAPAQQLAEELESPQKRRFSLFRWKTNESQSSNHSSTAGDSAKDVGDDNDKHGQLKQYQKTLASQTPESIRETIWAMVKHDHPDALMLRFLRARKWDVEKALVMLVSATNWRHNEMHVDSAIMKSGEAGAVRDEKDGSPEEKRLATDFMAQSRMGKSFIHGTDKQGRPICVVRVRLHKPGAQSAESLEKFTVFIIETARLVLEPPADTATIIFDMTGFSLANMDYHPVKFMIQCFEANYPECLGAVLVHNAPWVFQGIWRIIRGWLDPVVAAKVHFTNYRAGLEEYIAPGQIIKELEGDEDWEYKYVEPLEGENDAMKDTETRDQLLKARSELYNQFEEATRAWIRSPESSEGKQAQKKREEIATNLRKDYWNLDPYMRSRSLYDRQGYLKPGGLVNWYGKEVPTQANENGGHTPSEEI
ncbi:hypothetical protein CDD81_4281 [Ophiocordyceps australis]|uniref:CRAL-TRIO domain-containing protein n=1 Tax=Ophiocordyceps australis TaxID=1399860 RepID=A0A2C5XQW8_9HYPO|nr:hypothetical protein CDD81_4281 [Ophiocordyceps australis]